MYTDKDSNLISDWYPLSNIREMMAIENNTPQSVEMHMEP